MLTRQRSQFRRGIKRLNLKSLFSKGLSIAS